MFVFIRLHLDTYTVPMCNGSQHSATYLQGDYSSSAEFFVCVGVFGFLFCTATLILYLGFQSLYRQSSRWPIIVSRAERPLVCVLETAAPDGGGTGTRAEVMTCPVFSQDLGLTAAFAFLWLVSSSAWGKGLTDIKSATNPSHLAEICGETCKPKDFPSMGRLNASVVSPTAMTTGSEGNGAALTWFLGCLCADLWLPEPDPLGRKLLVHLQGNSFPQRPGAAGGCGGRSGSWALGSTPGSPQRRPVQHRSQRL